jgi:hypothetical protein
MVDIKDIFSSETYLIGQKYEHQFYNPGAGVAGTCNYYLILFFLHYCRYIVVIVVNFDVTFEDRVPGFQKFAFLILCVIVVTGKRRKGPKCYEWA